MNKHEQEVARQDAERAKWHAFWCKAYDAAIAQGMDEDDASDDATSSTNWARADAEQAKGRSRAAYARKMARRSRA